MIERAAVCLALLASPLLAATPAVITGSVVTDGARPLAGATVEVEEANPPCVATTASDGTFSLPCDANGRYVVRATLGDLRPSEVDDVELEAGSEVHLNFLLGAGPPPAAAEASHGGAGFAVRLLPNPVLATCRGIEVTLRLAAAAVAAISFVLGALAMLAVGRRFGIQTGQLSQDDVGDMVLNPSMPAAGERLTPIAVAGAHGASTSVRFGADEIAAALEARRYGLVLVALVVAPAMFATFALALATAMLAGHELYLFCLSLLVPAGFALTAIVIAVQAWSRPRRG